MAASPTAGWRNHAQHPTAHLRNMRAFSGYVPLTRYAPCAPPLLLRPQVIERASAQAAAVGADAPNTASSTTSGDSSSSSSCSGSKAHSLVSPFKPYTFDPSDLDAVQAVNPLMPPFAVMGSQVLLGPEDSTLGPVGAPYRRYLWGLALPLDREHSDLIILKQLLTGHQNRAVYGLLNESWKRSHAFFKCYEHLKRVQLEAKFAAGSLAASPAAILGAVEGLDVDMSPLIADVCGRVSSFGGGQQQLQDRLRCEEQHRLEHKLQQALKELQEKSKSEVKLWQLKAAVVLAFLFGVLLALAVAGVYMGWGFGGSAEGMCMLGGRNSAASNGMGDSFGSTVNNSGAGNEHMRSPAAAPTAAGPHPPQDCYWKRVYRPGNVVERVRFCTPI